MRDPLPTFPPLLTGHKLAVEISPVDWAKTGAAKGKHGAGDLGWSQDADNLRFALVLEPDVPRARCPEMLFVAMVAACDAIGALAPPEVSVTYRWPSVILANEVPIGFADLEISDAEQDGQPDWMVLSVRLRIRPGRDSPEPCRDMTQTTLWDEGCGELGRTKLLESVSRHLVNLIHTWSEDGFKPIHQQWWGRLSKKMPLADGAFAGEGGGTLLGLDDSGNALMKTTDGTQAVLTTDALERIRAQRGERV
jgi:biotin-(acetyl-CoA carboxylase) ligase